MGLISPKCTACGASLPPREDQGGSITCDYCGSLFVPVREERPRRPDPPPRPPRPAPRPPAPMPAPAPQPPVVVIHRRVRRGGGCGIVLVALMMMVGIGGLVGYLVVGQTGLKEIGERIANEFRRATRGTMLWDSVGGSPVAVTVGGEPAIVGRVRHMPDDELSVAAFRPSTGERLWSIDDLGTYSDGYQHTRFAVASGRVVVSDFKGEVRIAALRDGHVERVVRLTDKVKDVCRLSDGKGVWLDVIDERPLRLDPETGATSPMPRPAECPEAWRGGARKLREEAAALAPAVPGFQVKRVLFLGSTAIAAGVKAPGTAIPQAVRYDPGTGAIEWRTALPTVDPGTVRGDEFEADDLNVGRYVGVYGVGSKGWRVTAVDAKTGTRSWDVELRRIFAVDRVDEVVVSRRYVYVVRTSSVDVLDLATGKRVSTIGDETYEDER